MSLQVLILAAGEGTRMRSARPKVLAPLAGEPLLAHVLVLARALEPERIVVVDGHGGEAVRAAFPDPDLVWVRQERQLGTGDAVAAALAAVPDGGEVMVLYGDVPLLRPETLAPLAEAAAAGRLAILTARVEDPYGYGRIVRGSRGVERVVEERDASETERVITEINTGVVAAPAAHLRRWLPLLGNDNAQGEYYLTDVVPHAVADGVAVEAVVAGNPRETAGVNDRRQLAAAEAELRARRAAELLAAGVTLADPARIDVRGRLTCGRDVFIDVNTIFAGEVALGDGVRIGPGAVLRDATVGAGAEIRAYTLVENARVGERAIVGPFARLRPGAELDAEAHVGNFVEVKNARLGRASKANHLAYLGDAEIGARVNVGAGVITCNYDGAAKHKTVIGDDAFVGSDCPLVAPVTIGAGATVGAGSTITEDVPPGKLALGRARQTVIEDWQRPKKPDDK